MHKQPADSTWARIEVFVRTPDCEVDLPIVQFQGVYIPYCMGEIPADDCALHEHSLQRRGS